MTLTDEERRARAVRAEQILNDPVFLDAWQLAGEHIVSRWAQATTPELRERLHAEHTALKRLKESLQSILNDGAILSR